MLARKYGDKNSRSCEVVFQREGHDVETIYWVGPMEEVRELARKIALNGGTETYRVVEFTGRDSGVVPFDRRLMSPLNEVSWTWNSVEGDRDKKVQVR
jgi:hypothetical protein